MKINLFLKKINTHLQYLDEDFESLVFETNVVIQKFKKKKNEVAIRKTRLLKEQKEVEENKVYLYTTASIFTWNLFSIAVYPPLQLLSLPVYIYLIIPFFKKSYESLFHEKKAKMVIIDTIFLSVALLTGHFFVLSTGFFLYFFSKKLLLQTQNTTQQVLTTAFEQKTTKAWVVIGEEITAEINIQDLKIGDIVLVQTGETIPVDGIIVLGHALVDQQILTGESQLKERKIGNEVFAGTLVTSGKIHIEVEKSGTDTLSAQISKILNETSNYKDSVQLKWMKTVDNTTAPMLFIGGISLFFLSLERSVAIMSANFAAHMRILAPVSMLNFIKKASQNGILIKDGRSLEFISQIDTIIYDKTGTLTLSKPVVEGVYTFEGYSEEEIICLAAAAEANQTHPIAQAIVHEAQKYESDLKQVQESSYFIGYGVKAKINDYDILLGSRRFIEKEGVAITEEFTHIEETFGDSGSIIVIAMNQRLVGLIKLSSNIRPGVQEMINFFKEKGISQCIISGDDIKPTQKLAKTLGIENYYAQTLPQDKAKHIEKMQKQGKFVCFIGDGINDTIALKKANVSISISGASSIALDTAQIIILNEELSTLRSLFQISSAYERNIKRGFALNVIPGSLTVLGAIFLQFGITQAIFINQIGVILGVGNVWLFSKEDIIKKNVTKE